MIKQSTVIFNQDYIDELEKVICNVRALYDKEGIPDKKRALHEKLQGLERKFEWALDFQDIIDEFIDIEKPRLTTIKTLQGLVIPLRILLII